MGANEDIPSLTRYKMKTDGHLKFSSDLPMHAPILTHMNVHTHKHTNTYVHHTHTLIHIHFLKDMRNSKRKETKSHFYNLL